MHAVSAFPDFMLLTVPWWVRLRLRFVPTRWCFDWSDGKSRWVGVKIWRGRWYCTSERWADVDGPPPAR